MRVLVVAYQGARGAAPEQKRTPAQALERARMLSELARGGEHLAELVLSYSDRPGAGDDHGMLQLHTAAPEAFDVKLVQAALALPPRRVSDPIAVPEGYAVLERLSDPAGSAPQRIAAKHILISYLGSEHKMAGATRSETEARALAEQIVKQAKAPDANWDALAAQYTEEPGGKERAGDLGSFGHGQMVPAFDRAAFALPVGGISDVVQSPFGFHVIKRYQ